MDFWIQSISVGTLFVLFYIKSAAVSVFAFKDDLGSNCKLFDSLESEETQSYSNIGNIWKMPRDFCSSKGISCKKPIRKFTALELSHKKWLLEFLKLENGQKDRPKLPASSAIPRMFSAKKQKAILGKILSHRYIVSISRNVFLRTKCCS